MSDVERDIEPTPDGRRIVVTRPVAATQEAAWGVLTDTDCWPEWGPSVRAVDCEDRYVETGTTGRVRLPGGIWLPFEITSCEEYRWTWKVARIPATGHLVRPATGDETGCRAGFEIPLLAAGYVPVCVRALGHVQRLLAGDSERKKTRT